MKINIANPSTGAQKMIEVDDEKQLRIFYDRRISDVVDVDAMGGNFVGYQMRCVDDTEARARHVFRFVCGVCLCWESILVDRGMAILSGSSRRRSREDTRRDQAHKGRPRARNGSERHQSARAAGAL